MEAELEHLRCPELGKRVRRLERLLMALDMWFMSWSKRCMSSVT